MALSASSSMNLVRQMLSLVAADDVMGAMSLVCSGNFGLSSNDAAVVLSHLDNRVFDVLFERQNAADADQWMRVYNKIRLRDGQAQPPAPYDAELDAAVLTAHIRRCARDFRAAETAAVNAINRSATTIRPRFALILVLMDEHRYTDAVVALRHAMESAVGSLSERAELLFAIAAAAMDNDAANAVTLECLSALWQCSSNGSRRHCEVMITILKRLEDVVRDGSTKLQTEMNNSINNTNNNNNKITQKKDNNNNNNNNNTLLQTKIENTIQQVSSHIQCLIASISLPTSEDYLLPAEQLWFADRAYNFALNILKSNNQLNILLIPQLLNSACILYTFSNNQYDDISNNNNNYNNECNIIREVLNTIIMILNQLMWKRTDKSGRLELARILLSTSTMFQSYLTVMSKRSLTDMTVRNQINNQLAITHSFIFQAHIIIEAPLTTSSASVLSSTYMTNNANTEQISLVLQRHLQEYMQSKPPPTAKLLERICVYSLQTGNIALSRRLMQLSIDASFNGESAVAVIARSYRQQMILTSNAEQTVAVCTRLLAAFKASTSHPFSSMPINELRWLCTRVWNLGCAECASGQVQDAFLLLTNGSRLMHSFIESCQSDGVAVEQRDIRVANVMDTELKAFVVKYHGNGDTTRSTLSSASNNDVETDHQHNNRTSDHMEVDDGDDFA